MIGTKTILGFIAGASIGAIAAILFSPDKGSDTRKKIIDRSSELGNSLKDCLVDFIKGEKKVKSSVNGEPYNGQKMNLNTMG
jgi:gas vesicle protein